MGVIRRHGAELDNAIASAALDLVTRQGTAGVTMDAVAAAAKTSKPVLYRRWPDSRALLRDVLLRTVAAAVATGEDTGSFRTDMLAVLRGWLTMFTGPQAAVMRAVIASLPNDADLVEAYRSGVVEWRRQEMAALLNRGIARGDVRADVPADIVWELAQSVLFHRLLVSGDPITEGLVARLIDEVLIPLCHPASSRWPPRRRSQRQAATMGES